MTSLLGSDKNKHSPGTFSPMKGITEIGPGNLKLVFSPDSGLLKQMHNSRTGVMFLVYSLAHWKILELWWQKWFKTQSFLIKICFRLKYWWTRTISGMLQMWGTQKIPKFPVHIFSDLMLPWHILFLRKWVYESVLLYIYVNSILQEHWDAKFLSQILAFLCTCTHW